MSFLYHLRRRLTITLANNPGRMDELPPVNRNNTGVPMFSFGQSPITRSLDIDPDISVPLKQEHITPRNGKTTSYPEDNRSPKMAEDPMLGKEGLEPRNAHTFTGLLKTKASFAKLLTGRRSGLNSPKEAPSEKAIDRELKIKWELGNEVRYNRHRDLWRRVDVEGWQTRSSLVPRDAVTERRCQLFSIFITLFSLLLILVFAMTHPHWTRVVQMDQYLELCQVDSVIPLEGTAECTSVRSRIRTMVDCKITCKYGIEEGSLDPSFQLNPDGSFNLICESSKSSWTYDVNSVCISSPPPGEVDSDGK